MSSFWLIGYFTSLLFYLVWVFFLPETLRSFDTIARIFACSVAYTYRDSSFDLCAPSCLFPSCLATDDLVITQF